MDRQGLAIIVELHDHFKNGCSRSVYSATKEFELEWRKGESNFFVRKEYAPYGVQKWPDFSGEDISNANNKLHSKIVLVV